MELDSREEALRLVPPEFRMEAKVVELNKFTKESIANVVAELEG